MSQYTHTYQAKAFLYKISNLEMIEWQKQEHVQQLLDGLMSIIDQEAGFWLLHGLTGTILYCKFYSRRESSSCVSYNYKIDKCGGLLMYHLRSFQTCNVSIVLSAPLYVTGPAKIGHIRTQNLVLFFKFYLQYLLKYKSCDHKIFMPYS